MSVNTNQHKEGITMEQIIKLKIKSHYGKTSYYPTCEDGRTMVRILGTKTLPEWAMLEFNRLGYVFKEEQNQNGIICKDGKFSNGGQ